MHTAKLITSKEKKRVETNINRLLGLRNTIKKRRKTNPAAPNWEGGPNDPLVRINNAIFELGKINLEV